MFLNRVYVHFIMFKKRCPRCARKIDKDFDFCPYCGTDFRFERKMERNRDYGFLGKDDLSDSPNFNAAPFNLNNLFGSKLFNSLFQELDKQLKEMDKEMAGEKEKRKNNGISISISMSDGKNPDIRINGLGPGKTEKATEKVIPRRKISDEEAKKLAKLPKKEAKTEVRRFSNKIVYEIDLPGIKNLKDILINKLENSIEIKAFSKDTAYFKLLPVNLPILDYKLEDSKLILELKPQ